ncbi:uncharacterized protein [Henckelia pumila]|uniref:uncharacterized protein n=1 Tax=Henckelia pumila TaxID=405737 RepID=UPI003C6E3209
MMMNILIPKSLIFTFSKNPSNLGRSNVSFTLSLLQSFCTSGGRNFSKTCSVSDFLLHKHQFSPETVSRVASVFTRLKNPEKSDSILEFLKENGFSKTHLEKILMSRPCLLSSSLERIIKPKVRIFHDFGFSSSETARIISKDPTILYSSAKNRVIPSLAVLKSIIGSRTNVAKVLKKSTWFLSVDLKKNLLPNVKFLESCGIPRKLIINHIFFCPRFFLLKPEVLRKCVDKVNEMGVTRSSKSYIYAVRIISSMSNEIWEHKLQAFRILGFSEDDILKVVRKAPQVFCVSEEKIKNISELLLATGKYNTLCIVNRPTSLMYSSERYKPRLQVLKHLENSNLLDEWPSLGILCGMKDEEFLKKFVDPYFSKVDKLHIPECYRGLKRH